jgi:phospholipid/cholesterol/gamma-HCH transport system substrate-binding protein
VFISFDDGSGVTRDTPIKKSGITIGRVSNVELKDDAGALVTAEIDSDRTLLGNEVPRISGSIIGGDAFIDFRKRDDLGLSNKPIMPGDILVGEDKVDPTSILSDIEDPMNRALMSVELAGQEIGRLAQRLNRVLATEDDQLSRIVDKTERTLDNLNTTMNNVNAVVGDKELQANIKRAAADLPTLLDEAHRTIEEMQVAIGSANRTLKNVEDITAPLAQRSDQIAAKIDTTFTTLNYALEGVGRFTERLNDSEGTLAQLLNNPDLYHNLNDTVLSIHQLTKDLRPVVGDIRVFTDNLARHPGGFLRDAVRPGPGTKFK